MSIKLSNFTKKVLSNIAEFNGGVIIEKTNHNKTVVYSKAISGDLFLVTELPEAFEYDFVVSDLARFLNICSTLDDAEIELHKSYMEIISQPTKSKIKYCYADPRAVITSPSNEVVTGDELASVDISKEKLEKIKKQASILQLPHIQFDVVDDKLVCIAKDCDNPSSNTVIHELGDSNGIEIDEEFIVATDSLKIIPEDYQVTVCENVVKFNPLNNQTMTYYVSRYQD